MNDQNDPNEQPPEGQNPWVKQLMIWGGIFMALLLVVSMFNGGGQPAGQSMPYSEFRDQVATGGVKDVQIGDDLITGTLTNGEAFSTVPVANDLQITSLLEENDVEFTAKPREQQSLLLLILIQALPFILILGIAFFLVVVLIVVVTAPEQTAQDDLIVDQLSINEDSMTIKWQGKELSLTLTEFWLIESMARHPGHVKTYENMMQITRQSYVERNTINGYIRRIRNKFKEIDPDFKQIQTVFGVGYKWNSDS